MKKQQSFCNKLALEAEQELQDCGDDADKETAAISKLFQVKLGMPKTTS